jgi:Tripartite tricarboxylate transporter family receptor
VAVAVPGTGAPANPRPAAAIEYIEVSILRALGVTNSTRSATLPDIPTVGEFVPGYKVRGWSGVGAAGATPPGNIERLNQEINTALTISVKARLADLAQCSLCRICKPRYPCAAPSFLAASARRVPRKNLLQWLTREGTGPSSGTHREGPQDPR